MKQTFRSSRPLLYQEIVTELYRLIDERQLTPGQQLPSERELVERWNISRNVLREAFHVLEERGLISSRQGKGRFLRALPPKPNSSEEESISKNLERYSLLEIYQTRQCLESKAVELAALNATPSDLEALEAAYQELRDQFTANNSTRGEFEMHALYAAISKNHFLAQMIHLARKTTLDFMTTSFADVLTQHTIADSLLDHSEIIRAIRAKESEKAKAIMTAHMQHTIDMLKNGF